MNNDFGSALGLPIDLVVFGKFPPYDVDPVVFSVASSMCEHYERRVREYSTHQGPFGLLSDWGSKVFSQVTEAETMDVIVHLGHGEYKLNNQ